ncbi:MAG: histidinol-phosphate aminotransferase, partial [Ilumatobacter sp.]
VTQTVAERNRISTVLTDLGVTVFPSGANFLLFRVDGHEGRAVWQGLVDRSVLIRDCSGWPRLANCLRVTVGTPDENTAFLDALGDFFADESASFDTSQNGADQ